MTAVDVVCTRASAVSALTALVSTRIWALKLPQSPTLPAVRVSLVSEVTFPHLRGLVTTKQARVQVDAIAREGSGVDPRASANAVADAAHGSFSAGAATGLAGWTGEVGSPATRVHEIRPLNRREGYFADDLRQIVVSIDYLVVYEG